MIFMTPLKSNTIRATASMWQHSFSTIHSVIHEVIACFTRIGHSFYIRPTEDTPANIRNNPRFSPFFDDCRGALDGSHIPIVTNDGNFRNRKKFMSTNVLGVVNFDLTFSYVLAGWEGSAHDADVLRDALSKGLLRYPLRYYLGDAGYSLNWYTLVPYRGVRYHLKEWARGNARPQNYKELFNLRHASLRNVVERAFGVIKQRFPILKMMTSYPMVTQIDLINICFMIHNFIRVNQGYEDEFDEWNEEHNDENGDLNAENDDIAGANNKREEIAQHMWASYQNYLQNR